MAAVLGKGGVSLEGLLFDDPVFIKKCTAQKKDVARAALPTLVSNPLKALTLAFLMAQGVDFLSDLEPSMLASLSALSFDDVLSAPLFSVPCITSDLVLKVAEFIKVDYPQQAVFIVARSLLLRNLRESQVRQLEASLVQHLSCKPGEAMAKSMFVLISGRLSEIFSIVSDPEGRSLIFAKCASIIQALSEKPSPYLHILYAVGFAVVVEPFNIASGYSQILFDIERLLMKAGAVKTSRALEVIMPVLSANSVFWRRVCDDFFCQYVNSSNASSTIRYVFEKLEENDMIGVSDDDESDEEVNEEHLVSEHAHSACDGDDGDDSESVQTDTAMAEVDAKLVAYFREKRRQKSLDSQAKNMQVWMKHKLLRWLGFIARDKSCALSRVAIFAQSLRHPLKGEYLTALARILQMAVKDSNWFKRVTVNPDVERLILKIVRSLGRTKKTRLAKHALHFIFLLKILNLPAQRSSFRLQKACKKVAQGCWASFMRDGKKAIGIDFFNRVIGTHPHLAKYFIHSVADTRMLSNFEIANVCLLLSKTWMYLDRSQQEAAIASLESILRLKAACAVEQKGKPDIAAISQLEKCIKGFKSKFGE